jgi:hypothetical protein
MKKLMHFDKVPNHQRSQRGYFSGIYYVPGLCLGFPTLGPQAAFCKCHRPPARFPVTVTTFCRGVGGNSVPVCFSVTGLSF